MNEETYQQWWQLHLQVARGKKLTLDEQAEYEAGLEELDLEEMIDDQDIHLLSNLRQQITESQTIHAQLLANSKRLDKQIRKLEKSYQALTGYQFVS
jgi:hypothetical protein